MKFTCSFKCMSLKFIGNGLLEAICFNVILTPELRFHFIKQKSSFFWWKVRYVYIVGIITKMHRQIFYAECQIHEPKHATDASNETNTQIKKNDNYCCEL